MTGDPVTPFLVDAWSKGLLAGHEQEAYQALRANATSTPPADSPYNGRNGNPWYTTLGYIPVNENCVYKGGDNDCQHPASATLEYAAADASLSIMARGLGHTADARLFARRGENYRTLWDASIGFFRPRNADGSWLTPYDPESGDGQFHESGAYQYQWLVPQYTYAWSGEPDHTATVVRAQETLSADAPDGMTGNDDLGEMSSWLVMSSIGLYPVMSGADYYAVTSPQFPRAIIRVGGFAGRQGGTIAIDAPGSSWTNRYVTGMTVNGQPHQQTWVSQDEIAHGARISYTLGASPGTRGTAPGDAPPSVVSAG